MYNKIYDKIKKFIKEEYKTIIGYIVILVVCLYPLPCYLFVGGGLISLNDRITITNAYPETGSFNLSYVKQSRATIPTFLLSYLFDWERESLSSNKMNDAETAKDIWEREQIYLQEGNDNAIINAYQLAGEDITINKELLQIVYLDQESDTDLKVGDIILKVADVFVNSSRDVKDILKDKNYGDSFSLLVKRNDKEITCHAKIINKYNEKVIGIYLVTKYDYEVTKKISIYTPSNEGGSSGGLILSLEIYNRLTEKDLTGGLKIAGTGTIDCDGNIGEIGGVKYKLLGAVKGKADLFLVAKANLEEALKIKEENNYNIEIVGVNTLKDAITYLESR